MTPTQLFLIVFHLWVVYPLFIFRKVAREHVIGTWIWLQNMTEVLALYIIVLLIPISPSGDILKVISEIHSSVDNISRKHWKGVLWGEFRRAFWVSCIETLGLKKGPEALAGLETSLFICKVRETLNIGRKSRKQRAKNITWCMLTLVLYHYLEIQGWSHQIWLLNDPSSNLLAWTSPGGSPRIFGQAD